MNNKVIKNNILEIVDGVSAEIPTIKNQTILITGGAGFLGLEHAYALSKNRYNIIITDLNIKDLETAKKILEKKISNRNVIFKKMDVTKESDVVKILNNIEKINR